MEYDATITPYRLPDPANHSFFFIDVRVPPSVEADLHRHDAWELLTVVRGRGRRLAGDTLLPFAEGDTVLIPPSMPHRWEFAPASADDRGRIRYLMTAFEHAFVERCTTHFPELRNRLAAHPFPTTALRFGPGIARRVRETLEQMRTADQTERLCGMLRLLPLLFATSDRTPVGNPVRIERDVQRMQRVCVYVMQHYTQPIPLDEIAAEVCMNRSAFCSWFKRRQGITFSQYVTRYRLRTACELLEHTQKTVSEICYAAGFNDLPHFVRVFRAATGLSPARYRKRHAEQP